jgi:hypothetical protein
LSMGGPGSAFEPFVKGNTKSKAVVNTAFASVVPLAELPAEVVPGAIALAVNGQALSAVTAGTVLTSGPAISLAFYLQDNTNPFDNKGLLGARKFGNSDVQKDTAQASFVFFADELKGFSVGSTKENKSRANGVRKKHDETGKKKGRPKKP